MNSTRQQRKSFVKNAKKQWQKGLISKAEYLEIKAQMAELGREQHETLQRHIQENGGVTHRIVSSSTEEINIDAELVDEDDFAPEDL